MLTRFAMAGEAFLTPLAAVVGRLFLAVVLVLLLGLGLGRGLNHDEHQFVASGKLVAGGLLPYRDFPYFHTPLLSLLNGLLFRFTLPLLLTARLVSVLSAWLGLVALFVFVERRLSSPPSPQAQEGRSVGHRLRVPSTPDSKPLSPAQRLLAAASVVLLLFSAPIFIHTSGRAWNHDLPMLLALLAFLLQRQALATAGRQPVTDGAAMWLQSACLFGSGLLVCLAASTRLTFAVLAPVFVLSIWLAPPPCGSISPARQRWLGTALFAAGGLLGSGPALWLLWQAPAAFWFGNIEYIQLNTLYYRVAVQGRDAMTMPGKLLYGARLFITQPGNLLLLLAWAGVMWTQRRSARSMLAPAPSPGAVWLLLNMALLLTSLAALGATPSQPQYFFAPLPWLALGIGEGLAALPPARQRQGIFLLAGAGGLAALLALPGYLPGLRALGSPTSAYAWRIHSQAPALATLVDQGKVLTLAPIYPLEGDAAIEPALVTGPFAWRVAEWVDPERLARLGMLGPADLPDLWAAEPPRAVLVTAEADDAEEQRPLIDAALAHGYTPVASWDDNTLWLSPLAVWGEEGAPVIRLGGHTLPRTPIAPGEPFAATFYLQSVAPVEKNLNVLVRLVAEDGREAARSEGWPWGSATSSWPTGEVWPDGHTFTLPPEAEPGYYRVEMSFYDPSTLAQFGNPATVDYVRVGIEPAALSSAPLATLGDAFQLIQAHIGVAGQPPVIIGVGDETPALSAHAGEMVALELVWRAQGRPAADYTVFVHLVGPDGALLAQQDQPPLSGFFPTRFWRPGDLVSDRVELALPSGAPQGTYQLLIGMYDPAALQRLPVVRAGEPMGDALQVATIEVAE